MSASILSNHSPCFSEEELASVDPCGIPGHVAIIMDGNRRWAKRKNLPAAMGHLEGAETLTEIARAASELKIKTLTVYAFSTENWERSEEEVEAVMHIFELYLTGKRKMMVEEGIRLGAIGDLSRLPPRIQEAFEQTRRVTERCSKIDLVLALNYGGRDEIRRAVGKILARNDQRKIEASELTEEFVAQYLDTAPWGDPDLLIRTSGELRLSNFLLWQMSYTEFYAAPVLWPDFCSKDLLQAVLSYQSRQRRLGGF